MTWTIVHVSTERGWRGGEHQAYLTVQGLRERGHRCEVLARTGGQFAERLAVEGVRVHTYGPRPRTPQAIWRMRSVLRELRPHVLHYQEPHGLLAAGLASVGLGIPVRVASRRVNFPIHSAWKYTRFCDRVVPVSRAIESVCLDCGIPQSMLRLVCDGVDPARMAAGDRSRGRASLGLDDAQFLIVCVAALTDDKGHTFLLRSLPGVLAKHPEVVVALVGDGELETPLRREAENLGVSAAVRFLGYRDDVHDFLKAADLFVLPSHMEGLGSSLIDAMFAEAPIVCTTAGGMPEVVGVDEPDTAPVAFVCPPRDPDALRETLLLAIDSPEERRDRVRRGLDRARQRFTADAMIDNTLLVYREVIEASPQYQESKRSA